MGQSADLARPALPGTQPRLVFRMAGDLEVWSFDSIRSIDPVVWDSLVQPDEIQGSHAFIRACEDAGLEDARFWHLLIHRAGELIGIASLSIMPVRLDLLSTGAVRMAMQAVRRLNDGFLRPRVLFCGLPISAGRPAIAFRSPADSPEVLAAVARAMELAGREAGAQLHCVKEFSPLETTLLDRLHAHGFFRVPSLPTFQLAVRWRSLDEYLSAMRAGYRRQMLAGLRVRRREGLRVRRVTDYGHECARFFALYEQVMERAHFQLEHLNLAFFRNLNGELRGRTSAILIERGHELMAAAILLHSPGRLTFFMAGIDYGPNRRCAAYVNLMTEVVAEAIRRGASTLELGQTSPELKSRFGALGEDRFIYFRCPSPVAHTLFRAAAGLFYPDTPLPHRRVFRSHELR